MRGITATREIYEKAVESLEDERAVREMCLRYAELERKLGEIDRARAIYSHCSQVCDPRVSPVKIRSLPIISRSNRFRFTTIFGKLGKNLKSNMAMKIRCVKC